MLKLKENQKRQPVGGHHFTSHSTTFKGDTFYDVVKKLRQFRLINGLPVGDPAQEVLNYYAKNWPFMVMVSEENPTRVTKEEYVKWREWVQKTWENPPKKTITTKEAKLRWDVCLKCPFNKQFSWEGTDESAEITRRAFILRKGIEVPIGLGFCGLHSADLSVFVWIDNSKEFSSNKEEKQPSECWVGALIGATA
jgi:hypothetical protein